MGAFSFEGTPTFYFFRISTGDVLEFAAVCNAYRKCAKGKKESLDCTRFESRLGQELYLLYKELNAGTYTPGQGRYFIVTQPRPREIWASTFRDRVVHHLIVEPLEKIWEPKFYPKSFACRKGKGLHAAIVDFKKQVRRISQGGEKLVWSLQLDIESFFFTVDRDILKELYLRNVNDKELARLIELQFAFDPRKNFKKVGDLKLFRSIAPEKSWNSKKSNQGMAIGNLTSQFGANLYLNELDHFIARQLKPKGYLRYMDDLTLLDTDQEKLKGFISIVDEWLRTHRKQNLNSTKTILKPLNRGIEYLGFRLKQVDSPKEPLIVIPQPEKKWKLVKEARRLENQDYTPIMAHDVSFFVHHKNRQQFQKINSRLGLLAHTRSYKLRKKTLGKLATVFKQQKPDTPLAIRKDYLSVRL